MRAAFAVRPLSTLLLIVTLLLSIPAHPARATQTPTPGTPVPDGGPALLWQAEPPEGWVRPNHGDEQSGPVISGDVVVWPTDRLRAWDLTTGEVRWEADPGIQTGSNAVAVAGEIIVAGVPGQVDDPSEGPDATPGLAVFSAVGIDAATGSIRWATPVEGPFILPVGADGTAFLVIDHQELIAIDTATGEVRWEQAIATARRTGPAVSDGIISVTLASGGIAAFSAADGTPLWESDPVGEEATPNPAQPDGYSVTGPAVGDGVVVHAKARPAPISPDDYMDIIALDAESGEVRWQTVTDAFVYAPVTVADGMVLVQGGDSVRAFDAGTGDELWQFRTADGQAISSPPVVSDGVVYTSGRGERVHAIDAASGSLLWQANTRDGTDGPVSVSGQVVVVASGSGTIRAIDGGAVSETMDTGTPMAGGPPSADVSGIPPCTVTPREPLDPAARQQFPAPPVLEGTLSVTLVESVPDEHGLLQAPVIRLDELPEGPVPDEQTRAALENVTGELESCARLSDDRENIYDIVDIFQDEGSYVALFSDDFLRRDWVIEAMGVIGYEGIALQVPVPEIGDDVRVLPDGRVAAVGPPTPLYGEGAVYIFVEQDGQWLIDEYLAIVGSRPGRP